MEPELSTRSDRRPEGPGELADLEAGIGLEVGLEQYHRALRSAAQALSSDAQFGTCLITCSDEYQGDLRESFHRDVARPLMEHDVGARPRSFELSNIGARVEPAALGLVDDHFAQPQARGRELFVVQISAHLGRRVQDGVPEYGFTDRFGQRSACCGALAEVLRPPAGFETTSMPWLEQLRGSFGPRRLEQLRACESATRTIRQAVVHAVLQAEAALTELWREPPGAGRSVLLVATVTINQPGQDGILPVACHLLESDGAALRVVRGASLRATPSALTVETSDEGVRVKVGASTRRASGLASDASEPVGPAEPEVAACLRRTRDQLDRLGRDPITWRIYARPLLRSFFQALAGSSREAARTALQVPTDCGWVRPAELERVRVGALDATELCGILRAVEARIPQLAYADAQDLLDLLCAEDSPLLGA